MLFVDYNKISKDIARCINKALDGVSSIKVQDYSCSLSPARIGANEFSILTRLSIDFEFQRKWGIEVIRRSSQTLHILDISNFPGSALKSLLLDDKNKPIIYPNMETLDIYCESAHIFREKRSERVVHFPALKKLRLSREPLSCKALFRGSSGNLEDIEMFIYSTKKAAFRSLCNILLSSEFGFLKIISISKSPRELSETDGETDGEPDSDSDNDTDSNIDSDTESDSGSDTDSEAHTHILTDNDFKLLNILKSMTKRTDSSTRLEYCAEVDNSDISDILINRSAFLCLQKLNLRYAFFNFEQIAQLLNLLPRLLHLQCSLKDEPLALNQRGLPYTVIHIEKTMFPLHEYLQRANVFASVDNATDNMIRALGLLIAGCPRLCNIKPEYNMSLKKLLAEILKISDTKDFSKYKNRLKWIAEKNKANE